MPGMLDIILSMNLGVFIILGTKLMRRLIIEHINLLIIYNATSRNATPSINEYQPIGDLDINPEITAMV
jgi:hypothetical protein